MGALQAIERFVYISLVEHAAVWRTLNANVSMCSNVCVCSQALRANWDIVIIMLSLKRTLKAEECDATAPRIGQRMPRVQLMSTERRCCYAPDVHVTGPLRMELHFHLYLAHS